MFPLRVDGIMDLCQLARFTSIITEYAKYHVYCITVFKESFDESTLERWIQKINIKVIIDIVYCTI